MKRTRLAPLFLVPALLLVFTLSFVHNQRKFYMSWSDPSYAYLFNGLNIANGEMTVGHVDHPGTILQTFAGLVIRATYTFSAKEESLTADVIADPEKYLHVISFVSILLNCFVSWYAGYRIFRASGNMTLAVFLQSWSVVFFTTLTCLPDPRSEAFLALGGTLLTMLSFCYLYEQELTLRKKMRYAIRFAAVGAFLIVTKITALPLLLIPALLLWNWRAWLVYGAGTFAFAALFTIPAWTKLKFFFSWTVQLFTHSGAYGSGEEGFMDPETFRQSLVQIFTSIPDMAFTIAGVILVVTLLFLLFTKQLTPSAWKTDPRLRLLVACFLVAAAMVVIVGKHFKFAYLIPGYAVMLPAVALCFMLVPAAARLKRPALTLAAVVLLIAGFAMMHARIYIFFPGLKNPKHATAEKMKAYEGIPRIYVTTEYYSAEPPPALYFGYVYSGDLRPVYKPYLDKYYPGTYFYAWSQERLHDWDHDLELLDVVSRHPKMLVSFYYTDPVMVGQSLDAFLQLNRARQVLKLAKVYENPASGEQLYELTHAGDFKMQTDSMQVIRCDAETVLGYDMVSTGQAYKFWGALIRSQEAAHSGKFSLRQDASNPYGFSTYITIEKGALYEISVWKKNAGGEGGVVVACADDINAFCRTGDEVVEEAPGGWQKIRMQFQVPLDYPSDTLKVYTWNNSGAGVVYFDDLSITKRTLQ